MLACWRWESRESRVAKVDRKWWESMKEVSLRWREGHEREFGSGLVGDWVGRHGEEEVEGWAMVGVGRATWVAARRAS